MGFQKKKKNLHCFEEIARILEDLEGFNIRFLRFKDIQKNVMRFLKV